VCVCVCVCVCVIYICIDIQAKGDLENCLRLFDHGLSDEQVCTGFVFIFVLYLFCSCFVFFVGERCLRVFDVFDVFDTGLGDKQGLYKS